ncbi:MAG: hypothetical protein R3B06_09520 [Kofleriaceae bacterium]
MSRAVVTALAVATGWGAAGCGVAGAQPRDYELRIGEVAPLEPGAVAALSVALVPGPGRTVSAEGPVRLTVTSDAGVTVLRRRLARRDAADPAAEAPRFDVKLRAVDPGPHQVTVAAEFWLCARRTCRPIRTTKAVTVAVQAPAIDAGVDAPIDAGPDAAPPRARRR